MSSSSAVPHVPNVSKLIAAQSMDTRLWLRDEMIRLVDPMIDSLFLGLLISSSAQPSKQTNSHSTMFELCQLIEGEKETTNRLVRGQMDRLVNSLFLRLTNKALVNQIQHTRVSAFASVRPLLANHQTIPPNASIAQSSTNVLIDAFDEVKEKYDDDDEGEFMPDCDVEDCVNGICSLNGENDDENNAVTDTQIGLDQDEVEEQDQNASLESDLMVMPNVIDNSNQSSDNANDLLWLNKSEQKQIRRVRKSLRNATKQNSENGQSAQSVIEHNHQSTPSTSGLLSSARKQTQKIVFGYAQSNVNVHKSKKRKSGQAKKSATKDVKRTQIVDDGEDTDADDNDDDQEDHAIGEEISTANPIQPNLVQSNRHFQCSQCHKSFVSISKLHTHLRVHTGERPFQCDLCDKRFSQIGNLAKHQLIHQNIKSFECDQCEKRFTLKHQLDSHLLTHSGLRPFTCRHCAKSFTDLSTRNRHEQAIHLHVKPYRCKQCGHNATVRADVIKHIRFVHFGLPKSIKQQRALNIVDERDPRELLEKV